MRKTIEKLSQANMNSKEEKQKAVAQLKSLFVMYNQQKKTIEELSRFKQDIESDRRIDREKIEYLERANSKLKSELAKESENKNEQKTKQTIEIEKLLKKVGDKDKEIQALEQEKHEWSLAEKDYKEQLRQKDKKLMEFEHETELKKIKSTQELTLIEQQKEQLSQEIKALQRKLNNEEKETERLVDEDRKLRKQVNQLTFKNEELEEKLAHWNEKKSSINDKSCDEESKHNSRELKQLERLAEIERKIDAIATLPQVRAKNKKVQEPSEIKEESANGTDKQVDKEPQDDQGSSEDMLKVLTSQILQKDELKNDFIYKFFKLDKIQLEDKPNEYKNLLKSMGALYFANHYGNISASVFNHWKEVVHNAQQEEENEEPQAQEVEELQELQAVEAGNDEIQNNKIRGNTASDPGPLQNAESDEQIEDAEEQEEGITENKPGIEIDTELANKEAMEKGESKGKEENLLKISKKKKELIHVDENIEGNPEWNDAADEEQDPEEQHSDDSEQLDRNDKLALIDQKRQQRLLEENEGDEGMLDEPFEEAEENPRDITI